MTTFAQPLVTLAPSEPISITVGGDNPLASVGGNMPLLGVAAGGPQIGITTGGSAGTVTSVNGRTGAVLVLGPLVTTLTDAPSVSPDLIAAGHFRWTLGGNRTLANPTNALVDGQRWMLEVIQDGVGGRTLGYGSAYDFGTSIGLPSLSSAPGKRDFLGFVFNISTGVHYCVGFVAGY
jgi:hypothetical protein